MIIQPFNDIHADFVNYNMTVPVHKDTDVVVFAGDVGENIHLNFAWMNAQAQGKPVVYVLGNHEFYGYDFNKLKALAAEVAEKYPNIHLLDDDKVEIDGVTFIGGTLWTDFNKECPVKMQIAKQRMQDYRAIKIFDGHYGKLMPKHTVAAHKKTVEYIKEEATKAYPAVIVTHHAPHPLCVHKKYKGDILNDAYFTDLDWLFPQITAKFWFHGHMHDAVNIKVCDTRIVCNPHGYPKFEFDTGFNPNMLVKV